MNPANITISFAVFARATREGFPYNDCRTFFAYGDIAKGEARIHERGKLLGRVRLEAGKLLFVGENRMFANVALNLGKYALDNLALGVVHNTLHDSKL